MEKYLSWQLTSRLPDEERDDGGHFVGLEPVGADVTHLLERAELGIVQDGAGP